MAFAESPLPLSTPAAARDLGHQALRGSAWLTTSHILIAAISFLRDLLIARLVLPEAFGLIALVRFFLGTVRQPFELNLDLGLIYRNDRLEEATVTHVWLKGALACAALLLILAARPLLLHWYPPLMVQGLIIAGIGSILQDLGSTPRVLLERRLRFQAISVFMLVSTILQTVVAIGLALRGWGFWSLLVSDLIDMIVPSVAFWLLVRPPLLRRPSPALLRWFLTFSWPMWVGGLLSVIIFTVDDFFVGTFAGASALGLYSLAYTMMKRPTQLITHVLDRAWVPAYARLQSDRASRSALYAATLFWIAQLTTPLCVGLALIAPELLQCVVGTQWLAAALLMQILVIFAVARSIQDNMMNLLFAIGQARLALRVQWVEAGVMLAGGALAAWGAGAVGVCWVVNVMMVAGLVVTTNLVKRFVDLRFWRVTGPAILSSGLAVAVIEWWLSSSLAHATSWIQLAAKAVAFPVLYSLVLWALNRHELVRRWRYLRELWST